MENTGPRIGEIVARRLIEPFYQLRSCVTSDRFGRGLGLAVVRSIVHAHHGTVTRQRRRRPDRTRRAAARSGVTRRPSAGAWRVPYRGETAPNSPVYDGRAGRGPLGCYLPMYASYTVTLALPPCVSATSPRSVTDFPLAGFLTVIIPLVTGADCQVVPPS